MFQLNLSDAQDHIEYLTGDRYAKVLIVLKDDDGERLKRDSRELKRGAAFRDLEGPYIASRYGRIDALANWIEAGQRDGCGVYVLVNDNGGGKGRKYEDIQCALSLWHEDDATRKAAQDDFPLRPSFGVESSLGRFHSYWLIDRPGDITLEEFEGCQMRIAKGWAGDEAAKHRAQILRLAGSWNLKPGREPWQVRIYQPEKTLRLYGRDELLKAFPPLVVTKGRKAGRAYNPGGELPADAARVRSALDAIRERCEGLYHDWLEIGMALHDWSGGSLEALELWQTFCYDAAECEDKWSTFHERDGGVSVGTIYHHAEEAGWSHEDGDRDALAHFAKVMKTFKETGETGRKKSDEGGEADGFRVLLELFAASNPTPTAIDLKLHEIKSSMPGAPGVPAMRQELKQIMREQKAALEGEEKDGVPFPHYSEQDGLPRRDSLPNANAWIEHHGKVIWWDEFADVLMFDDAPVDDKTLHMFREQMHADNFFVTANFATDALIHYGWQRKRHPVREYFDKVRGRWDGKARLDTWLIDFCGAPDNQHWRAAGRLLLIAVVMRTRHPGAKFDYILSLIGDEGLGKSSLCRALAINDDWWLEGFQLGWDQKKMLENTTGIVIAEYGEMAGHSQREQASLKDAASRTKDRARKAYGRFAETKRRGFVTIANANELEPLLSKWGNRRFWPLHVLAEIDVRGLEDVLDQLYGEAVHAQEAYLEAHGTTDVVLDRAHWAYFGELQETHRMKTPIEERVARLLDGVAEGHARSTDLFDVLDLKVTDRFAGADIEHAMKVHGWKKVRLRMHGDTHPQTYFTKGGYPESTRLKVAEDSRGKVLAKQKTGERGVVVPFKKND